MDSKDHYVMYCNYLIYVLKDGAILANFGQEALKITFW